MTTLRQDSIPIPGGPLPCLRGGDAAGGVMLFLHGGVPGVTPYCSGAHVWGECLERFAATREVIALDLPGAGRSAPRGTLPTIDDQLEAVAAALDALRIADCHVVGHDVGGLLALLLACAPASRVRAVTVVSSVAAAPSGDGVDNLAHAYPPPPLWSRRSQRWALEQVSFGPHHVSQRLLDDCEAAASGAAHREAVGLQRAGGHDDAFVPALQRAKTRLYQACRGDGVPAPVQVVWGEADPLGSVDQGLWLFRLIAQRQPATHFHLLARAGALPFREAPEAFHAVVEAFDEGLRAPRATAAAGAGAAGTGALERP